MNYDDLKKFSWLTYGLERIFFFLQFLSPANLLLGTRSGDRFATLTGNQLRAVTIQRGRGIEFYLLGWLILESLCCIAVAVRPESFASIAVFVVSFRIFEILQAAVNMNIFDRLRFGGRPHYMSALARTLVLSCINFVEIMFCFGTVYSAHLSNLKDATTWTDAYYFSTITQLTIGYGDITPTGVLRGCVALQGLIGFFFGLIVLSRFVSYLPRTDTILGDHDKAS